MAYNKFTLKDLKEKLNLKIINFSWLPDSFVEGPVDALLLQLLNEAKTESLNSEKARSEFIISPVLKAFRRYNKNCFSFYSGYQFNVDTKLHLNGYCDFIFSLVSNSPLIEAPVFCVVEAKKEDIDNKAIAQCGAEMVAIQLFNQQNNKICKVVYGCVTTAFLWCFLKLEKQTLYIDTNYIPLTFSQPHTVLAALQWLFATFSVPETDC
jgi:hypothetical protein